MKRIWLFILMLIPFTNVYAIGTYYSEYRDYKLGTEEVLDLDDTLKREEYTVYNTEVTDIEDQGYVDEDICSIKYPNDTKVSYTIRARSNLNNRWYESINIPEGNIVKLLYYSATYLRIYELDFYDGNQKVNVSLAYDDPELSKIIDGDTSTNFRVVPNQNIDFVLPKMNAMNFRLVSKAQDKLNGSLYFTYEDGTIIQRKVYADEVEIVTQSYLDEIEPIVGVFSSNGQVNSYEKEEHILYHCYKKNTYVTNIYKESTSAENERLILDDNKTLYNYYIRDKVKISDKKITSDKTTLKELVTYSTIDLDNLRIEGNVDYTKNGTYQVKYIFNDDFVVDKEVVINISKNDKVIEPTTTKSTSTTTTKPITTKTSTTTTSTTRSTTTKSTTKVKTTTKNIKPNDTCPTYNTYPDEEILDVVPLKGSLSNNTCDKKNTIDIIIIILLIIALAICIIALIRERSK